MDDTENDKILAQLGGLRETDEEKLTPDEEEVVKKILEH